MSKAERLTPTSKLRLLLLDGFYRGWLVRGGPNDYFPFQQIWDEIYSAHKTHKAQIDGPLAEGAMNGLLRENYLRAIQAPDGTVAAQITPEGRSYREELRGQQRNKILAYVGAITGSAALLWDIVKPLIE